MCLKIGQLLSTRADLLREDYVKALSALRCRRMCRQQPESLWIPMAALLLSSTTMSEKAVLHDIGKGLFIAASLFRLWQIQSLPCFSGKP